MFNGSSSNQHYDGYDGYDGEYHDGYPTNAPPNTERVQDAITYLNSVRSEFQDRPDVYAQFLDVMKDFKSQVIDTPGVIERVSNLFRDFPTLILGFNTFLPPGYQVRYIQNRICVIDPNNEYEILREVGYGSQYHNETDYAMENEEVNDEGESDESESTEDEINENEKCSALLLLDKVRARFSDHPFIYRKFLDLVKFMSYTPNDPNWVNRLTAEQRAFKKINRTRSMNKKEFVTHMIAKLFVNDIDLIHDYLQVVSDYTQLSLILDYYDPFNEYFDNAFGDDWSETKIEQMLDEEGENEEEGDENDIEDEESDDFDEDDYENYEQLEDEDEDDDDDNIEDNEGEDGMTEDGERRRKRRRIKRNKNEKNEPNPEDPCNEWIKLTNSFDSTTYKALQKKMKKSDLGKMFLLINMYVKKDISKTEFVQGIKDVLGYKNKPIVTKIIDLLDKRSVNEDSDDETINEFMNVPSSPRKIGRSLTKEGEVIRDIDNYTLCTLGVSYRHIKRDGDVKCSGKTLLCDQVLNDTWTSYPSWSSEDNGNVSSKKSPYEEFLYRTEDERFELDIVLDVNKYAIESLEQLKQKMEKMTESERLNFRLDEKLGCSSGAIITRAIRRIYGEAATKIISGLRDNPYASITRVLIRLVEKEKEWREAQHQMNRMWREQLEKQLVRSLDHQTANVKQADARLLKPKTMIAQIESFFDSRQGKNPHNDEGPHITYMYPERRKILHDVNDIIIHYLKRNPVLSKDDKKRMKIVLRKIVLEWFCEKQEDMSDDEKDEDLDLDRKKYKKDNKFEDDMENKDGKRVNLLKHYADDDTDEWPIEMKWVGEPTERYLRSQKNMEYRLMYGDDMMFVFMRLHHSLCDRLSRIHSSYLRMCDEYYEQLQAKKKWEKDVEGLAKRTLLNVEKNWGELGQAIKSIRNIKASPLTYYNLLINEIKRYLDGEMDTSSFEDALRGLFPTEACLFFSVDKILGQAVKSLGILANNEDDCQAIKMYLKYRLRTPPTAIRTSEFVEKMETEYAAVAEYRLHGKNCFRFELINDDQPTLSIMLVDTEDSVAEEQEQSSQPSSSAESVSNAEELTVSKPINKTENNSNDDANNDQSLVGMNRRNIERKHRVVNKGIVFMNRSKITNKRSNRLELFEYRNFNVWPNVPSSDQRGGFYASRKPQSIEFIKKRHFIRKNRCEVFRRYDNYPPGALFEKVITKEGHLPQFDFLTFKNYTFEFEHLT